MTQEIEVTEEIKTGELTVQNYEIVGFDESIIPVNRVAELKEKFVPMLQTFETHNENRAAILEEFKQYTDEGTAAPKQLVDRAKRHRLDIGKIRIAIEKARKATNDEINKQKTGTDSLCKFISENITKDEKEMAEKETHNDKLEADRLKVVQEERSKLASEFGFTEEMDFSGMAQTVFDSFIAGQKVKRDEVAEFVRKQDLRISRQTECLNLSEFIEHYEAIDLGELRDEVYTEVLESAKQKKLDRDEEIKAEKEVARLAKIEADKKQEEIRLENERLKAEREEAEAIEAKRIKTEAIAQKKRDDEKDESDRKARLQVLAKQKADNEASEAIEKQKLAEQREAESKAEIERLKQEKIDSDIKHAEEVKALAESSKEITPEAIKKAIEAGDCIFVKVVSVEKNAERAGIFIQSSDN